MLLSSPAWDAVVYWALDLETGGLDPARDAILSVGLVPIRGGHVRLGEAWGTLVRPEAGRSVDPRSVVAHQLLAAETREAPPLAAVLPEIERRIAGHVLLVHHRALDVAFLSRAHRDRGERWRPPPVVDTVALLRRLHARRRRLHPELAPDPPSLNLAAARAGLGLPAYQAHDALTDAIATAELFLALREALAARRLRDLK